MRGSSALYGSVVLPLTAGFPIRTDLIHGKQFPISDGYDFRMQLALLGIQFTELFRNNRTSGKNVRPRAVGKADVLVPVPRRTTVYIKYQRKHKIRSQGKGVN